MDLAPKPQNPWNKLFSGFCDPNKENADDSDNDENDGAAMPEKVRRSVSFSNQVTVSDGKSTPQATSLNENREARLMMNGNDTPPPAVTNRSSQRSIFPKKGSSFQTSSDTRQPQLRNQHVQLTNDHVEPPSADRGLAIAETQQTPPVKKTEAKPPGILKPPAVAMKKTKPSLASPRSQRILELLFLTTLTLGTALSVLYFGLGYRLDVTFDSKPTRSAPIRVSPKQQQQNREGLSADKVFVEDDTESDVGMESENAAEREHEEQALPVRHVSSSFAHEGESPDAMEEHAESFDVYVDPAEL